MQRFLIIAGLAIAAAAAEAAPRERFCSIPAVGEPNCSYSTVEACRAANRGMGSCSPESWLEKRPAQRTTVSPAMRDALRQPVDPFKSSVGSLNGW